MDPGRVLCPVCGAECAVWSKDCWMCHRVLPPLVGPQGPTIERSSASAARRDANAVRVVLIAVLVLVAVGGLYTGFAHWIYLAPLIMVPLVILGEVSVEDRVPVPRASKEASRPPEPPAPTTVADVLQAFLSGIAIVLGVIAMLFTLALIALFIACSGVHV